MTNGSSERVPSWVIHVALIASVNRPHLRFASESDPAVAVCMLPGTELAFAEDVKYDNRWIWTKAINFRVGKFGAIDPDIPHRHHDAIEFPDGSNVLVTQLCEGQRATVLQLPMQQVPEHTRPAAAEAPARTSVSAG